MSNFLLIRGSYGLASHLLQEGKDLGLHEADIAYIGLSWDYRGMTRDFAASILELIDFYIAVLASRGLHAVAA